MLRRLTPALLTLLVVALGVTALAAQPAVRPPERTADFVVLAGVAGLRWEDVDARTTPTLWRLARDGSIGSLAVRSAQQTTCPVDGWLTLGAGSYAAWPGQRPDGTCPPTDVVVERPDGIGANLPEQESVVLPHQERLPWGTVPGSLSESVRCSVAVGPGAAVAAARPFGRVDRYAPELPADPADLLRSCVLSIIDLGAVAGEDPAVRAAAARAADARLAQVLAARPPRSLVIVAGVADTEEPSRLHVAVADGPGWERGWLTSPSTGRRGYLQLVDLAPTALTALGRPLPERPLLGRPAESLDGRSADLATAIAGLVDADREAAAQRRVAGWFFGLLAAVQMLLGVAVLPLLRRARRHAGPHGPQPVSRRVVAVVELLLVAAALAVPSALVADLIPWWRGEHPGVWFTAATIALMVVATALVRVLPGYRSTLGPLGAVAGLTTLVIGADVLTDARLQLHAVVGYSAVEEGRFAGLGTVGLGVLLAGALLSAGWLAQRVRRSRRPVVIVVVGGVAVVVVGSPYLGADSTGAVAVTAGVSVAAAISAGGWLTLSRLAWATMAGLAVTVGFAMVDLDRPTGEQGDLGGFLAAVGDGTGGLIVRRASSANLETLLGSPLTMLALAGVLLVWFALLQPWGGLRRLFGIYPAVRAAMTGTAVAAVIGGLLGGVALDVAGSAAALAVPMAALAALRVLDHATDRTRPEPVRGGPDGVTGDGPDRDRGPGDVGPVSGGADPADRSGPSGAGPAGRRDPGGPAAGRIPAARASEEVPTGLIEHRHMVPPAGAPGGGRG